MSTRMRAFPSLAIILGFASGCVEGGILPPNPTPLAIDSVRPGPDAVGVDWERDIVAYFAHGADPATLTSGTAQLTRGGEDVPTRVWYDPVAAAVHITAPLLPATTYAVRLTAGIRDSGGGSLPRDTLWTFSTRASQSVVVDPGPNGAYTALALGPNGARQLTYDAETLRYAQCATNCAAEWGWASTVVDSAFQTGRFGALAIDGQGRRHISYAFEDAYPELRYATCASGCLTPAGWTHVLVDTIPFLYGSTSIAVNASGGIAIAVPSSYDSLRVALCAADCLTRAHWSVVALAPDASSAALASGPDGRLHLAYYDGLLWYATCVVSCGDAGQWTRVVADTTYAAGLNPSVVLDGSGTLHLSYHALAGSRLRYATCSDLCASSANWTALTVDSAGSQGFFSAVVVDDGGRVRIVHAGSARPMRYSACVAACTAAAQWQTGALTGDFGSYLSARVDEGGRVHVSYRETASGQIRYLQ